MGHGGSYFQRVDIIDSYDPRITGRAAIKGTTFRYIPAVGIAQILIKEDDGFSTNWSLLGTPSQQFIYYVTPGLGDLPTIQSAINKAFADGSGSGHTATIYVPPGNYIENLTFKPGQSIIAQTGQNAIGSVAIQGQHSYTPPVNGNPLGVEVVIQGFTFVDPLVGDTIRFLGPNGAFFSLVSCAFNKASVTGHSVASSNAVGIFIVAQCSVINYASSDSWVTSNSQITVLQLNSHSSFASAPMFDYTGSGNVTFSQNQATCNAPYIASFAGGQIICNFNFLATFAANADGLRFGPACTAYFTNGTMIVPTGTGYVFQGTGTLNGAMIVYGDNNVKDPGLTFNLLSSDP